MLNIKNSKMFMLILVFMLSFSFISAFNIKDLRNKKQDTCNNFDGDNGCRGNQTDNDDSWAGRNFQTPPSGDPLWREGYQDYSKLVGYARTVYSSSRKEATITVLTTLNPTLDTSDIQLKYSFRGISQDLNQYKVDSSLT